MQTPIRKSGKYTHAKPDPNLTQDKFDELKAKLKRLKEAQPQAIKEMKRLAEMADFSENAAYAMAKGRLRGINQRILELENEIKNAVVIAPIKNSEVVQLGSQVTVEAGGQQTTFLILGSSETDPGKGIISHKSPIGAALMGHRVGDSITFAAAPNSAVCRIIKIG